ncbi:hypothetical protein AAVH_23829 [Aphelenchoides avenae]|nr:hypothetical protein AAVH_23829 [Aphelenchus avenae]
MPSTAAEPPAYKSAEADDPILPQSYILDASNSTPKLGNSNPSEHDQLQHEAAHHRRHHRPAVHSLGATTFHPTQFGSHSDNFEREQLLSPPNTSQYAMDYEP